jgi:hypothetical protein
VDHIENKKTIGNKGDFEKDEIRYRGTAECGQVHPL